MDFVFFFYHYWHNLKLFWLKWSSKLKLLINSMCDALRSDGRSGEILQARSSTDYRSLVPSTIRTPFPLLVFFFFLFLSWKKNAKDKRKSSKIINEKIQKKVSLGFQKLAEGKHFYNFILHCHFSKIHIWVNIEAK